MRGLTLTPGLGHGAIEVLDEPLSFWGGTDPHGTIIDRNHPQFGLSLTNRVIAMPSGRGSSSSASVLAEQIRIGTAPSAVLLAWSDAILALGALVASTLYAKAMPIVVLDAADYDKLPRAGAATVEALGEFANITFGSHPSRG